MKVLVFGNKYLKEDNFAIEVARELKLDNINFIFCESPEQILDLNLKDLIILDVVKNLKDVQLIDLEDLQENNIVSLHDFDIGFFLKLLQSSGKIENIKIIGIPTKGNKEKIKAKIIKILNFNRI